jgi:hypothetical protein
MLRTAEQQSGRTDGGEERPLELVNKDIPIVPQAEVVKSGVVRVMELQEKGWSYVKP